MGTPFCEFFFSSPRNNGIFVFLGGMAIFCKLDFSFFSFFHAHLVFEQNFSHISFAHLKGEHSLLTTNIFFLFLHSPCFLVEINFGESSEVEFLFVGGVMKRHVFANFQCRS